MNSSEKEVIMSQLESERQTLFRLKDIYEQAARDVSEKLEISNGKIEILLKDIGNADEQTRSILQSQIYQRNFQKNLKSQLDFLLEDLNDRQFNTISEYLEGTYENGFIGTLYNLNTSGIPVVMPINPEMVIRAMSIDSKLSKSLYESLGEDVGQLKKRIANNISRGISTASPYRDIARNIAVNSNTGFNNAMRIVRTESGRIYNAASLDSAKAAKAKTGADLVKVWDSTLDSLTRPHHRQLDNQARELDEDFEIDGLTTSAPGHFGIAKEDINCRCVVLIEPRWDLEGPFTKRNNETGELLEFQDVQDYQQFKEKYWEKVDKDEESGIINLEEVKNMSINAIELPIEQKHTGKGNPNAVLTFGVDLNNRQKKLLELLPQFDSRVIVLKKSVNMTDLAALTSQTGHEFAMFTKGKERLIIRGNAYSVNINVESAKALAKDGYRWSGHTHPGIDFNCLISSPGDKSVLKCFGHKTSVIYNSKGQFATFEKEE